MTSIAATSSPARRIVPPTRAAGVRLAFCNELLADEGKSLAQQAAICAALGYDGLELAPGTLADRPHLIDPDRARAIRDTVEGAGLGVTGLHWLLSPYPDLSVTATDPAVRSETQAVLIGLVGLCAALGGDVLVHGSPGQRRLEDGETMADAIPRAVDFFGPVAKAAEKAGVTYCIEPLSRKETRFVNTVEEAARLVEEVGSPSFRTMIDTSAAGQTEAVAVADLIRRWVPTGLIGHVQLNETNRGAPGTGDDPFPDILAALKEVGWDRTLAIEPFATVIDATTTAAIGAATVGACWRAAP